MMDSIYPTHTPHTHDIFLYSVRELSCWRVLSVTHLGSVTSPEVKKVKMAAVSKVKGMNIHLSTYNRVITIFGQSIAVIYTKNVLKLKKMYQIQFLYVNIVSFLANKLLLHHCVMYFRDSLHVFFSPSTGLRAPGSTLQP